MPESAKTHLLGVVLFLVGMVGCTDPAVPATPRSLPVDQIASTIRGLPSDAHFSLSGLDFFKGKLYVSSNVGLFVLSGASVDTLYQWVTQDDVVEGPWVDKANDALWIQHAHDNSLARFDGSSWRPIALPVPPVGFTRGDVLTGFIGISASTAFWLVGGGRVWQFDSGSTSWIQEPEPPAPQYSAIRAVAPFSASMLYVVREGIEVIPPSKYAVYDRQKHWERQDLSEKMDFGGLVTTTEGVYVRATDGRLYSIGSDRVEILETPGQCEAIAQTSTGKLLASFVDRGVFLLDNGKWDQKVSYPHGIQEGEHWAYLAESNGQIAYATSSVPQIQANARFTDSGFVALWIQREGKLERVSFH